MRSTWLLILCVLAITVAGCDSKESAAGTEGAAAGGDEGAEGVAASIESAEKELSDKGPWDKELMAKVCDILTPEIAAKLLEVPEDELEQITVRSCIYNWKGDGEEAVATFGSITVKKDAAKAKTYFDNSTKNRSAAEVKEMMDGIIQKAKDDGKLDTKTKEKAGEKVGDGVVGSFGSDGMQWKTIEGVGDQARMDTDTGQIWVRVGNMRFIVMAYKGPSMPEPGAVTIDPKDPTAALKEIGKKQREWEKSTVPSREKLGSKLAKIVIERLEGSR